MRIAEVIGTVTCSRAHPTLAGAMFRLAVPLSLDELLGKPATGEAIVVYDELNAGEGQLIGISEGREAAQPFEPDAKAIDAYNAAILDHVDVQPLRANQNK